MTDDDRIRKPMLAWFTANNIDYHVTPVDAGVVVDETAATITVEQWFMPDGKITLHGDHAMTTTVTVPLLVQPPPGLLESYRQTVIRIRRNIIIRDAGDAIRELLAAVAGTGAVAHRPAEPT